MGDSKKHENKATRKSISLETKMQVIRRLETGERQYHIGAALNLANSTVWTILTNKENVLPSATVTTTSSATTITRSRNITTYEMDSRLSIWIDDEIKRNLPLSQSTFLIKRQKIGNTEETE
ncbi:hypothetical protein TNCV_3461791 [Trichonephila clavipes]|nr:hypothetical protein TNCV_3461791 [Trichonephila clavipes]